MAVVPSPEGLAPQRRGSLEFSGSSFAAGSAASVTTFPAGTRIHWRARFARPARSIQVALVTVRRDPSGWEEVVSGTTMWLPHPDVPGYAGWIGPGAYEGAGTYVLRIVVGDTVLAEGSFTVVEPPGEGAIH